jgi:hypothetical protein
MAHISELPQLTISAETGGDIADDGHTGMSASKDGGAPLATLGYSLGALDPHQELFSTIVVRKGQTDPEVIDATIVTLKVILAGRTLDDVPPVGQDNEFRAWVQPLCPVLVSMGLLPWRA